MDFDHEPAEVEFRSHVQQVLRGADIRAELAGDDVDERRLYRLLGRHGLLGVAWPRRYGGQGRSFVELAIVAEELVRAGIPDTLFVNGIQTVGQLLLIAGSDELRASVLPPLASGEKFASVLYTEPDAGSDLGALTCAADRVAEGFRLNGTKVFNLKTSIADLGLCAARTAAPGAKYAGITLFVVDLRADGVRVSELDSLPDEPFHVVTLDDVLVRDQDVVGGVGDGWALLAQALPLERAGLDFVGRAERWHDKADGATPEEIARYSARIECARLLSWRTVRAITDGVGDQAIESSMAKWYASELAAEIAGWAWQRIGLHDVDGVVSEAWREAPGLTLAGGTSEMMLQTVAGHLVDLVGDE
jgi:alkylation response protein AidB-like acyl-CoA dehydrogenase